MTHSLQGTLRCIPDSKGAPYLAVVVDNALQNRTLLDAAWAHLATSGIADAIAARHARDGAENAHVTVVNVAEWGGLAKYNPRAYALAPGFIGHPVTLDLHGVGKAVSKNTLNTAWFGILTCEPMAAFRSGLGLQPHNFHVTLAFLPKDVFDADKGLASLVVPVEQLVPATASFEGNFWPC